MTQTPDDWMADVREPVLGFLQPMDDDQAHPSHHEKHIAAEKDNTSNLPPVGERIHRKYEMNIYAAEELIALIYAAKIADIKIERENRGFSEKTVTLMEYAKNVC